MEDIQMEVVRDCLRCAGVHAITIQMFDEGKRAYVESTADTCTNWLRVVDVAERAATRYTMYNRGFDQVPTALPTIEGLREAAMRAGLLLEWEEVT